MNIEFIYMKELESFVQILMLGFVLSLPVCYLVESLKATEIKAGWFYFIASILISAGFGLGFADTFTEMNLSEGIWLAVCLWLGSQGFYEKLKASDGMLGKMFVSVSDMIEKAEPLPEEEPEKDFLIFPVNYVGITTPYSSKHPAVDFGFSSEYGGKNQPIIAPSDMEIVAVGNSAVIGRNIRAYATINGEKYTYRFIHLSDTSVEQGQKVKKGEVIGKMGDTGSSSEGFHLHFDIWKGHTADLSSSSQRYAKSVDPLEMCYLTKDQIVGEDTDKKYNIMRVK